MDDITWKCFEIIFAFSTIVYVIGAVSIVLHLIDHILNQIGLVRDIVDSLISLIKRSFGKRK